MTGSTFRTPHTSLGMNSNSGFGGTGDRSTQDVDIKSSVLGYTQNDTSTLCRSRIWHYIDTPETTTHMMQPHVLFRNGLTFVLFRRLVSVFVVASFTWSVSFFVNSSMFFIVHPLNFINSFQNKVCE